VLVVNPLIDAGVLAELRRVGGATGFSSRGAAMRQLFGGLLPDATLTRENKASFSGAAWGPETRRFAAAWSGLGVDAWLVDIPALRREWLSPRPDFRSSLLLHSAWLRSTGPQSSASSS
jgi:hypothetical protein